MSIPRPTRAECEAILGVHVLYWCSQCGQAWSLPERESHLMLCRPSSPEHYRHILTIDAAALAHAYLAQSDENEALAKAVKEQKLRIVELFNRHERSTYESGRAAADDLQLILAIGNLALAEYAKRKQEREGM